MEELSLKEIQKETLETFKVLDSICRKNNLHYYLAFGTLIGAVRHNGIIPWDDDIDIMMMRDDFNKLAEYVQNHQEELKHYRICTRKNTRNYSPSIPRFVNTDFIFESSYSYEKKFEQGVFVDIYPLDNCGNSFDYGKNLGAKIRKLDKKFMIKLNPDNGKKGLKGLARKAYSAFLNITRFDFEREVKKITDRNTSPEDKYVGVLYDCDPMEKSVLSHITEHQFEDMKAYIPEDFDSILNLTHKGYMTLPPESERVPHHNYKIFRKD